MTKIRINKMTLSTKKNTTVSQVIPCITQILIIDISIHQSKQFIPIYFHIFPYKILNYRIIITVSQSQ